MQNCTWKAIFVSAVYILVIGSESAWAKTPQAECSPVDLSDRFSSPKDQGSSDFCYAFAASDLLAEALGLRPPETISALQVVTNYITSSQPDYLKAYATTFNTLLSEEDAQWMIKTLLPMNERGYGWSGIALELVFQRGTYCLEQDLPSQHMNSSKNMNFITDKIMDLSKASTLQDPPALPTSFDVAASGSLIPDPFHPPKSPVLNEFAAAKLKYEIKRTCTRPLPQGLATQSFYSENMKAAGLENTAMQILNAGRVADLMYDKCKLVTCPITDTYNHDSLIVGRKWNAQNKTCELKIRNSWGRICPPNLQAGVRCQDGYYWIEAERLFTGSGGLTLIYQK